MVQNPNFPRVAWQAAFGSTPNSTSRGKWCDLSARTPAWSSSAGRQYELGQVQAGVANLTVENLDEALTPDNVLSPYYASTPARRAGGSASTGAGVYSAITANLGTPLAGSLLLLVADTHLFEILAPSGWTPILPLDVVTAEQTTWVWWKISDGTDRSVTLVTASGGTGSMAMVWAEYTGVEYTAPVDVTATASRTSTSATQATGTTAATTESGDLVVYAACPHGFDAGSTPTSPSWTSGTARTSVATSSATDAANCCVMLADRVATTAGTQTSTATWTNSSAGAVGMVIALKARPQMVPWQPVRGWAAWPHAGNLLNSTNTVWSATIADSSTFEGGTVGAWGGWAGATLANSTTRAHEGTHSLRVTWPTAAVGVPYAYLASASLPPLKIGTTYTVSAWVWVAAGSCAVLLDIQGTSGTASTTTGAWERISVTWTAIYDYNVLHLRTAGASTAGHRVWVDSVQMETGSSPTAFTTSGPTVHPLHTGFVERYPGSWTEQGFRGWQGLTAVDALAALAKNELQDCLTEDLQQDTPMLAYALDDPAGSVFSRELRASGFGTGVAAVPIGLAAAPPTFGAAGGPGVDGATCVTFAPAGAAFWGLQIGIQNLYAGDLGPGVAMEVWFKTATHAADQCVIVAVGYDYWAWEVRVNTSGLVYTQVTDDAGSTFEYTIVGPPCADGAWHHVVATESASGATITGSLYVDGILAGTDTRSGTAGFRPRGWWIGSQWWPVYAQPLTGSVARFAWYQTALSAARALSHYHASLGFPYDTTSTRIARVLGWVPWAPATTLPATSTTVSPASGYAGRTVHDIVQALAATENGAFLACPDGGLELIPRHAYYQQTTPVWTFGEDTSAGEYPYEPDFATDRDPTYLSNKVVVTRDGGVDQLASNPASQALFFPSTLRVSTAHATDAQARSLAEYLQWRYARPRTRIVQIAFKPAANTALWPMVLGARIGDRVRVMRRTNAATYTLDCFIESIHHAVDPTSADVWVTSMQLSPVDPLQAGLIGDATYGLIGTAVIVY